MSGIKGANTAPELAIRSGLHRLGYRFRLHDRKLPGRPDIVLRSRGAVIEVRGCFWHGHDCNLFRWPKSRREFWAQKIIGNINRDTRNRLELFNAGWRVAEIWECQLKGQQKRPLEDVLADLSDFLQSSTTHLVIGGEQTVGVPAGT